MFFLKLNKTCFDNSHPYLHDANCFSYMWNVHIDTYRSRHIESVYANQLNILNKQKPIATAKSVSTKRRFKWSAVCIHVECLGVLVCKTGRKWKQNRIIFVWISINRYKILFTYEKNTLCRPTRRIVKKKTH